MRGAPIFTRSKKMRIMAIDLGDVRTGLAVCDKNEILASPVCTVEERDREKLAELIAQKVNELGAEKIVLGLPKNMDGTEGERVEKTKAFKEILEKKSNAQILLFDERCTTISAQNYLNQTNTRGKKRKKIIDTVSATIILQGYLDFSKNTDKT